jgi:hypothetical protein
MIEATAYTLENKIKWLLEASLGNTCRLLGVSMRENENETPETAFSTIQRR